MAASLEAESTLPDRCQTTVPETVRRALRLGKRDKIHYTIHPGGEVVLTRSASAEDDDIRRAYESSGDAYRTFRKMIENGHRRKIGLCC